MRCRASTTTSWRCRAWAAAAAPDADAVKAAARAQGPRGKFTWLDSFFEFLSDSFRPILGALLGASLFITFMALMSSLKIIPNWADPNVHDCRRRGSS